MVALQQLFRVYPELKAPTLEMNRKTFSIPPNVLRTLCRYGIATPRGVLSGSMIRMATQMLVDEAPTDDSNSAVPMLAAEPRSPISEWAEELSGISYRRNMMERSLRAIVINFLRAHALGVRGGPPAKSLLLACVPDKRKAELEPFNLDNIGEKLFWLELVSVINKHWQLFERIFGDKSAFNENASVVNDRPDAHAKRLESGDIAMHRRALQWLDERIARV
jgi:hypothetical protein